MSPCWDPKSKPREENPGEKKINVVKTMAQTGREDKMSFQSMSFKRLCLSNRLVDPWCIHLIRDLYSPVPVLTCPASQYHANTAQSSGRYCNCLEWKLLHVICPPSPGIAHNPAAAKSAKRLHFMFGRCIYNKAIYFCLFRVQQTMLTPILFQSLSN